MSVSDDNFAVTREQVLYSQLRDGASFFRSGDERLYIRKNRFIATVADRYDEGFVFISKDGLVETFKAKQIRKGEIENG